MKWGWKSLLYSSVIAGTLLSVVIIMELYFNILDWRIINVEKQLPIEVMHVNNTEPAIKLSLQDEIDMLEDSSGNIDQIDLKMGNTFSLYEARKQCHKELCKIPVLEMDLYGPNKDEIDIKPKLYIDTRTPSYAAVVWTGTVTIKGIIFQIALEEENGKVIQLQYYDGNLGNEGKTKKLYEEAWKDYLEL